jgi:hypothetical protein
MGCRKTINANMGGLWLVYGWYMGCRKTLPWVVYDIGLPTLFQLLTMINHR